MLNVIMLSVFAECPGAYPKVEDLNGALLGKVALPANIRLGRKRLSGTNAHLAC
jgi:hypothetical protein